MRQLAHSLRRRCRLQPGARILVAVSGGPDSVALLRGLSALAARQEWKLELSVGHVQHHLREQAEADARFVEELAQSLKLPFLRADLDLKSREKGEHGEGEAPADPQQTGGAQADARLGGSLALPTTTASIGNLEANARQQRYDALVTMARAIDADFVATAHHGDDQMETLLMRLLRGTSVRGLRGMPWRRTLSTESNAAHTRGASRRGRLKRPRLTTLDLQGEAPDPLGSTPAHRVALIRPLLSHSRCEIDAYLAALKQPACIDHTNADVSRLRARLRRDVMPVLRDVKPDIAARAASLADHLRQVEHVLDDAISAAADRVVVTNNEHTFDRTDARTLRPVVLAGLLRRLLVEVGVDADRLSGRALAPLLRAIRDRAGGKRTFDFQDGARVTLTRGEIRVERIG